MVVVSANSKAPQSMNLPEENFFPIWDWVGGRFSVWSAVGLPCAIALGPEVFRQLLTPWTNTSRTPRPKTIWRF